MRHAGDMVKKVMRDIGMTQVELSRRIGRDQTLISRFLSGKVRISETAARSMAEVLDMDFEELRIQMQKDKLEHQLDRLKAEHKNMFDDGGETDTPGGRADVGGVTLLETQGIVTIPMLNSVPVNAHDWREEEEARYPLPPDIRVDAENSFAVKAAGKNVTNDEVNEGDTIVIDSSAKTRDGDIVLVIVKGEPMLRRIYRKDRTIVLQASAESKEPLILLSQKDDFQIVGRMMLCARDFTS